MGKYNYNIKREIMGPTIEAYLSKKQFEKELEDCLTIISYPSEKIPYYICEYIKPSLDKVIVNVYVEN